MSSKYISRQIFSKFFDLAISFIVKYPNYHVTKVYIYFLMCDVICCRTLATVFASSNMLAMTLSGSTLAYTGLADTTTRRTLCMWKPGKKSLFSREVSIFWNSNLLKKSDIYV